MARIQGQLLESYSGWCRRCGCEHQLANDVGRARETLEHVFARVEQGFPDVKAAIESSRGKMVGALVGRAADGSEQVLMGFSGDLLGRSDWAGFVPSIFRRSDTAELEASTLKRIAELEAELATVDPDDRRNHELRAERRRTSANLMAAMFDAVRFTNASGVRANIRDIFHGSGIPSGTGECAVPKLLNAANVMGLRPVAIAEAWYGPAVNEHVHGVVEPPCARKCQPILGYLLCKAGAP